MSEHDLINDIPPIIKMKVSVRMRIAAKIMDLIGENCWSKSEFAGRMNKRPSEVTKWLSGTHNFTIETLCEIATVFGVRFNDLIDFKTTKGGEDES